MRKLNTGLLLTLTAGALVGCTKMSAKIFGTDSGSAFGANEPAAKVGFMSSEQILKAMIATTGTEGLGDLTDPADDAIDKTYKERSGSLPSVQSLNQATGPTLISATNLASSVCAKAVDRDRATGDAQRDQRLFFREVDFSKGLNAQASDAVTASFGRLARNAWRRPSTAAEDNNIITFAQEFSAGANATDPAQTRMLAVSICTAVLSSIDALTY